MSVAYLVMYEGQPENPEAFLNYYLEEHVPLVWKFPKIRRVEVDVGQEGDFFLIARLHFDTMEDLREAIDSPERWRSREDMANFPPFDGTVRWQIVEITETEAA